MRGRSRYQPLLASVALAVARLLIKPVQDGLLGLFAKRATAVMTNVPGPAVALELCGATLRQTMFWVPAWSTSGVGVSILSYGGGVQFGPITDKKLSPHPRHVGLSAKPSVLVARGPSGELALDGGPACNAVAAVRKVEKSLLKGAATKVSRSKA